MTTTIESLSWLHGKRVAIYWNLHKRCWSVQWREGPDYGRVACHITPDQSFGLASAKLTVGKAGRERVLKERKKNVHAFITGYFIACGFNSSSMRDAPVVGYNPYVAASFVRRDTGEHISSADLVTVHGRMVCATSPI